MNNELKTYIKSFPDITPDEKKELIKWVKDGNSPYDNGYFISDENGRIMDFINAERLIEAMIAEQNIN